MQYIKSAGSLFFAICLLLTLTACGGGNETPKITELKIAFDKEPLSTQTQLQLNIIAKYDNGESKDVTAEVNWDIDKGKIASINDEGLISTNEFVADFVITATYLAQSISQTFSVTPSPNATLLELILAEDTDLSTLTDQQELVVIGKYSDASIAEELTVKVESQSNSGGAQTIRFKYSDTAATEELTVNVERQPDSDNTQFIRFKIAETFYTAATTSASTIAITPALSTINLSLSALTVQAGESITASAEGVFDDNSIEDPLQDVTWQIIGLASIDSDGIITASTAVTQPTTALVVVRRGEVNNSRLFTITPLPTQPTVPETRITSINLSLSALTVQAGASITASAEGIFDDNSIENPLQNVTWQIVGLASIDSNGIITANTAVTQQVNALVVVSRGEVSSAQVFTITPLPTTPTIRLTAINLSLSALTVQAGKNITASAEGVFDDNSIENPLKNVTWQITGPASIDANGIITANATGITETTNAQVFVKSGDITRTQVFVITPLPTTPATLTQLTLTTTQNGNIAPQEIFNLTLTGTYSDDTEKNLTTEASWTSLNNTIVTVDNSGQVSGGNTAGTTQIRASIDGLTATYAVTLELLPPVLQRIELSIDKTHLPVNSTAKMRATAYYSDNSSLDISAATGVLWVSSNTSILVIEPLTGALTSTDTAGTSLISVTFDNQTAKQSVEVSSPPSATISSIKIAAFNTSLSTNSTLTLRVDATYSDGITEDVSPNIIWSSNSPAIASVETNALLTTFNQLGTATITATLPTTALSDSIEITVIDNSNSNVNLMVFKEPFISMLENQTVMPSLMLQYKNSETTTRATNEVTWLSSDPDLVSVDSNGLISSHFLDVTSKFKLVKITATYIDDSNVPETILSVLVFSQSQTEFFSYQVNDAYIKTHVEDHSDLPATIDAFYNASGVLVDTSMPSAFPGYFVTATGTLLPEKMAIAFRDGASGTYDKSSATFLYAPSSTGSEYYTLDNTDNTSLSVTVNAYPGIGEMTNGIYEAVLCKQTDIAMGNCNSPLRIQGAFNAIIRDYTAYQCYSASQPKNIDRLNEKMTEQICNTSSAGSFYRAPTTPGVSYLIRVVSNNAEVTIVAMDHEGNSIAESVSGNTRTLNFKATSTQFPFSLEYLASEGTTFEIEVIPQSVISEGSLLSPVTIDKGIPASDILTAGNTQSYYKIAVTKDRLYRLSYVVESQNGNTLSDLVLSVGANSNFSNLQTCSPSCSLTEAIRATDNYLYIKLQGPTGTDDASATISITLEYQSDRDPSNYDESLTLTLPVTQFQGQAGGSDSPYEGPQGSLFWINGLEEDSTYMIRVSGANTYTRMWSNKGFNGFTGNLTEVCNGISAPSSSSFYCIVTTKNTLFNGNNGGPPGFPLNIVARSAGTPYTLDITKISKTDVYYVSTFGNGGPQGTGDAISATEIALYRQGSNEPDLVSADNFVRYTKKAFYLPSGETVDFVINDPFSSGHPYSVIIKRDDSTSSSFVRPENPDIFESGESDNDVSNATPLNLNEASHHTLSTNDGDYGDLDWFSFTAP